MDFSYHNQTTLHPVAIAMLGICAAWMLVAPRRHATAGILVLACFVSQAQRLVVAGFDFTLMKIMVLVAVGRVMLRGELRLFRPRAMDLAMLAWVSVNTVAYTLLYGSFGAFANRLGWIYDVLGTYLMFRVLLLDWRDVDTMVRWLAWLSVPVAAVFMVEKATGHNMFSVFGGVEAVTLVREGRLRCQGAFAHPIIAGMFWVVALPLFVAMWWGSRRDRRLAVIGCAGATVIIVACASSTPTMGFLLVIAGFAAFPWRRWLGSLFLGLAMLLVVLHFYRDKPVWHLLSRIDLSGGSTGWHRYRLMDGAIRGFDHWWMLGTKDTEFIGAGVRDITNQYLVEGFRGGFAALLLFVLMIGLAFASLRRARRRVPHDAYRTMQLWGLSVALVVHCAGFLAVSYFGQASTMWYLQLALVASTPDLVRRAAAAPARASRT